MLITIPPWDVLVAEFGIDRDGDIGTGDLVWYAADENIISETRIVEIADAPDEDGDYALINAGLYIEYIFGALFDICDKRSNYGTAKFLRRPYGTD